MSAHEHFNALVARPDHWLNYSLRDAAQLLDVRANKSKPPWMFVDSTMEAARIVVPPFNPDVFSTCATDVTAEATQIQLTVPLFGSFNGSLTHQSAVKIGAEVLEVERAVGPSWMTS